MLCDEPSLIRLATDEAALERLRAKAIGELAILPQALHARETYVSLLERSSSSPAIKASALRSLNRIAPDDGAIDAFVRKFVSAPDAVLHEAACEIATDSKRLDDVLFRLLDDANPKLVYRACLALEWRGKITTEILGRLASHPSADIRQHVLNAYRDMSTSEAENHIVAALRDPDATMRGIAAHELRKRRLARAVPALEAALDAEKDANVAHSMAKALEALCDSSGSSSRSGDGPATSR
jgi:hypothetical protein